MRALSASQPRNPQVQRLAAELSRQERARDSAMAGARSCTLNKEPACAVRYARRAVALDPRNAQTQATMRDALATQNATNTAYFRQAKAMPKPVVPTMTFDGRWSVSPKHTAAQPDDSSHHTSFGWGVPTVSKGRGDAH